MTQLHVTLYFPPELAPGALSGNTWSTDHASLTDFARAVLATPGPRELADHAPSSFAIELEEV